MEILAGVGASSAKRRKNRKGVTRKRAGMEAAKDVSLVFFLLGLGTNELNDFMMAT